MARTLHRPNHPELRDMLKITHEDGRIGLHLDPSLIPGGVDVLDRMHEASASDALRVIGHEPVARILASLREEHARRDCNSIARHPV